MLIVIIVLQEVRTPTTPLLSISMAWDLLQLILAQYQFRYLYKYPTLPGCIFISFFLLSFFFKKKKKNLVFRIIRIHIYISTQIYIWYITLIALVIGTAVWLVGCGFLIYLYHRSKRNNSGAVETNNNASEEEASLLHANINSGESPNFTPSRVGWTEDESRASDDEGEESIIKPNDER